MCCMVCGQALVAGQAYCPRCGLANSMGMPMAYAPAPYPPLPMVERRIDSLAYAWLAYAGLALLFGVIGLSFAHAALDGSDGWAGSGVGHMHWHWHPGMGMFRLGWRALTVRVGLATAAGIGLLQKASWGRWVAIVAGVLAILHPLFGTILGIWTLVVLCNGANAAGYEAMVMHWPYRRTILR